MFHLTIARCGTHDDAPSLWLIAVIFAFVISLRRHCRVVPDPHAVNAHPACANCRYSLAGLSLQGTCPECGITYDIKTPTRIHRNYTCHGFGCQLAAIAIAYCCIWPYAFAATLGYQLLRGWPAQDAAYQVWHRDTSNISRDPPFWYEPPLVWHVFAAAIVLAAPFISFRARWTLLISGTLTGGLATCIALTFLWRTARVLEPGWNTIEWLITLPAMLLGMIAAFFLTNPSTKTSQSS